MTAGNDLLTAAGMQTVPFVFLPADTEISVLPLVYMTFPYFQVFIVATN